MKKSNLPVKPWCPFCGADVARPQSGLQRKMTEFPMGKCECGAVYVCDATGHNVGSAMVDCLVHAAGDNWDLAWDLLPEDDYLTGRLEDYDEKTHQVIVTKNQDGRAIRGVLYFVRLHKDVAEIAKKVKGQSPDAPSDVPEADANVPALEPERDPKRKKQRASKEIVKNLVEKGDISGLVDYCFDDKRTLRFIQRLLYEHDEGKRYRIAWLLGQVCARVATREPGQVADLMHRLYEASADSASTSWGMIEAIGAIISGRADIFGAFTRYLLNFLGDDSTRPQALWALGEVAAVRPDLIRKVPFYGTFEFLGHADPLVRGLTARLLGRVQAKEASLQILPLQNDSGPVTVYEKGCPVETTVGELARVATQQIHNTADGEQKSE